jgi:hypothetical protein
MTFLYEIWDFLPWLRNLGIHMVSWHRGPQYESRVYNLLHLPLFGQAYPDTSAFRNTQEFHTREWEPGVFALFSTPRHAIETVLSTNPERVLKIPDVCWWGTTKCASGTRDLTIATLVPDIAFVARFEDISLLSWQLKAVPDIRIPVRSVHCSACGLKRAT